MQDSWIATSPRSARRWASEALVNRNYTLFMAGSFVSALGSWFQSIALGWLVLDLDNSPFALGLVNFALMAPLFFLGLVGGLVADRVDRRRLLIAGSTGMAVATAALTATIYANLTSLPVIIALALVMGVMNAFIWPTWGPFIKDLVGPERLRPAIALNMARFNLTRVLGPAIAGWFLVLAGVAACMLVNTVTTLGVVVSVYLIRLPPTPRSTTGPASLLTALREGVVYSWSSPTIRRLLVGVTIFGFFSTPYITFLPAFARNVFDAGAEGLGWLMAAGGLGAVGGAIISGSHRVARNPSRAMALLTLITGAGLAGFAASGSLLLALITLVLAGFGSTGFLATANATLQLTVPDRLMGRIMGLWVVLNAGTMPLGSLVLGALADRTDVRVVVVLGAIAALAAARLLLGQRFEKAGPAPQPG